MVAHNASFTEALMCWKLLLTILSLIPCYCIAKWWLKREMMPQCSGTSPKMKRPVISMDKERFWTILLGVLAVLLILLQAYIPARYEHSDDDDSRFVSEEVSAVEHDTMYRDHPITGMIMEDWERGEVKKDMASPWAMYVAFYSKLSNIPPAMLSHAYLPFFMTLLCYAVYYLIGSALLKGNREKIWMFLIFLSVIHMWNYTSTHTLGSMLLLRIWQGKAVCASFMLPFFFYLMYQIMQERYEKGWIAFSYVVSTAACLLSGIGIVTMPVVIFLYGLVDFLYHRNGRKLIAIWGAAAPCAVYLLISLIQ
jgi:hypothetical protein